MACFIVPGAEAVVTTVITKIVENKEHKKNKENEQKNDLLSYNNARDTDVTEATNNINRLPFSKKLKWLNNMLWGGTALLAFEHLWHGEITPWFPFLTAAGNPQDTAQMISRDGNYRGMYGTDCHNGMGINADCYIGN